MKTLTAIAIVAVLGAGLTEPATASINYNASKSNTGNYTFNPTDAAAAKKCRALGGTASAQKDGTMLCVLPAKPAPKGTH